MKTPYRKLWIILGLLTAFVIALQFTSVELQNPPALAEFQAPREVKKILQRACYDCHSNQSKPEWYDKIAPVSFLVAHDVLEARSRFNFSEWDRNLPAVQQVLLWEMVNAIEQVKMPLKRYTSIHPQARVSAAELRILKGYVNTLSGRHRTDITKLIRNPGQDFKSYSQSTNTPVSLNGIPYTADYKNWKVISITDKYDGGSMRIVYGNEKMVKAIQDGQLPFPDGAKMVKVVWGKQQADKDGNVLPGNFQNVQLMIKNAKKYKATEGWGFARFDGLTLKPFGKTAGFDRTCINCHRLLVPENDFVFNIPTKSTK
jgi:hypothetical protein